MHFFPLTRIQTQILFFFYYYFVWNIGHIQHIKSNYSVRVFVYMLQSRQISILMSVFSVVVVVVDSFFSRVYVCFFSLSFSFVLIYVFSVCFYSTVLFIRFSCTCIKIYLVFFLSRYVKIICCCCVLLLLLVVRCLIYQIHIYIFKRNCIPQHTHKHNLIKYIKQ